MDIEKGEYIRNSEGRIDKVKNPDYYMSQYIECEKNLMSRASIVNHSKNIIDLIEVGDYVNGIKVINILPETFGRCKSIELANHYIIKYIDYGAIKSIVTSEQFSSVEYVF